MVDWGLSGIITPHTSACGLVDSDFTNDEFRGQYPILMHSILKIRLIHSKLQFLIITKSFIAVYLWICWGALPTFGTPRVYPCPLGWWITTKTPRQIKPQTYDGYSALHTQCIWMGESWVWSVNPECRVLSNRHKFGARPGDFSKLHT